MKEKLDTIADGIEGVNFEKNERPRYKYYYHGSFLPFLDKIEKDGFKFREYSPNLTLSPTYGFKFLEREIKKGPQQVIHRGKHLQAEEKNEFKPDKIKDDDSVLLVIEPTREYKAHSTNEGKPNLFSTPDQIPLDVDQTIRTRIWNNNQQAMFKEPIFRKASAGVKLPGMQLNKKMSPTGEMVAIENDKKIMIPGKLPASSVKMIIKKDAEFLKIFQDIRERLNQGEASDFSSYRQRLIDYFKNSKGIIKNEVENEAELAENMVMGEVEHYVVTAMRNLYLDIERFKGKKFISLKDQKETAKPIKTKEQLLDEIEKLRSIQTGNEVFKRYIEIYTNALEDYVKS